MGPPGGNADERAARSDGIERGEARHRRVRVVHTLDAHSFLVVCDSAKLPDRRTGRQAIYEVRLRTSE